MTRPLRYEAAGAVCHMMARQDGGKAVFEEDKDRYGWVNLMEKACAVVITDSKNNTPLSNLFVRLSQQTGIEA